ncbi:MAG: transglutaminase domain-containing protein [Bacteroidota bacterium]
MNDILTYFAANGPISDPGPYAYLLDGLPEEVPELCRLIQGTHVHAFWGESYGYTIPDDRKDEVQLRTVERRLAHLIQLDPRPLTQARPVERRLVGNCRDFALMLACILRHQGRAARARCGFGAYFLPGRYEDHWVCEVWNVEEMRWVLVDAQLDEVQCRALQIPFDPLDVPRGQFITGGRAWQMCRSGEADPDHFGIFDMHGLWFVRGDLIRDVAALNKMELLPWDSWGLMEEAHYPFPEDELAFLDHVADLSGGDVPDFWSLERLYETDTRLHVPDEIKSYARTGVLTEQLGVRV